MTSVDGELVCIENADNGELFCALGSNGGGLPKLPKDAEAFTAGSETFLRDPIPVRLVVLALAGFPVGFIERGPLPFPEPPPG